MQGWNSSVDHLCSSLTSHSYQFTTLCFKAVLWWTFPSSLIKLSSSSFPSRAFAVPYQNILLKLQAGERKLAVHYLGKYCHHMKKPIKAALLSFFLAWLVNSSEGIDEKYPDCDIHPPNPYTCKFVNHLVYACFTLSLPLHRYTEFVNNLVSALFFVFCFCVCVYLMNLQLWIIEHVGSKVFETKRHPNWK